MNRPQTTDPRDVIANSPMSRLQIAVIGITIALNALDGFDILSISFASPGIRKEWGIDPAALGVVLSMELIGMAIGSIVLGGVSDTIGRRRTTLGCLIMMAFSMMIGFDMQRSTEVPMTIAVAGLVLSTLGAVATFVGFVAQVGIARRSAAVSEAVGRTSTGIAVCILVILGIAVFYTLMSELTANPNLPNYGYSRYGEHEVFFRIVFLFLMPLSIGVILVLYHRMLAAGRRALQGEPSGRYDG